MPKAFTMSNNMSDFCYQRRIIFTMTDNKYLTLCFRRRHYLYLLRLLENLHLALDCDIPLNDKAVYNSSMFEKHV
jgi:hypothetical protein